jgi:pimeloyl-ACP methyl ester carboxylesterase
MPAAADLYYTVSDMGTRLFPPVLLIHGAGGSHLSWPSPLRRLARQRVYTIDLPGRGNSTSAALQSVSAMVNRIIAWMDEMDFYQIVAIGHALGGAVALQLAVSFPKRISKMGMISASAAGVTLPGLLNYLTSANSYPYALKLLKQSLCVNGKETAWINTTLNGYAQLRPSVLYSDWLAWAQFAPPDLDWLTMPIWLATGDADPLVPFAQIRALAQRIPTASFHPFPGAGHLLPLECPEQLAESLKTFLT